MYGSGNEGDSSAFGSAAQEWGGSCRLTRCLPAAAPANTEQVCLDPLQFGGLY